MTTQTAKLQPTTQQNLRALISEAWAATDVVADQVQLATREAAFTLVLEAMLRNGPLSAAEIIASLNGATDEPIDPTYATPSQRIEAIASYLELSLANVEDLYDVANTAPRLRKHPRLESGTDQQIRSNIALLVCAGRTAVGLDTGTDHIRRNIAQITGADVDPAPLLDDMREFSLRGDANSPNRLARLTGWGLGVAREVAQDFTCL